MAKEWRKGWFLRPFCQLVFRAVRLDSPPCSRDRQRLAKSLTEYRTRENLTQQEFAAKPKEKGVFLRRCIDFVFGFENKKGEILDSWIVFADSFSLPPQEFYAAIEKEMNARKIPSMEISREEFSEGGLLSDKRIYLRLFRERLALYTCAAPFGTGYFFSCRTVYVPALVRLWHIVAAFIFFTVVGGLLIKPLGITFAAVAMVAVRSAIHGGDPHAGELRLHLLYVASGNGHVIDSRIGRAEQHRQNHPPLQK